MSDNANSAGPGAPHAQQLRREDFTEARVAGFAEIAARAGFKVTTAEERAESLRATLARHGEGDDIWIFGYGSLMWNPALDVAESRIAKAHGYHRHFCLDQQFGRGSPERPGIMLALDRGGHCHGVVHRIAAARVESELRILWLREMPSGAYRPRWIKATTDGGVVEAIAFVINRDHPRYLGRLPVEAIVERLSFAEGQSGTNRQYLHDTVECIRALGIVDRALMDLSDRVARRRDGHFDPKNGEQ
jgi:cation transport protein ChaC